LLLYLLDEVSLSDFDFFSIAAASTPSSFNAIGDIAAACIDTFLAASSAPSTTADETSS
jgi:hypothetical protein